MDQVPTAEPGGDLDVVAALRDRYIALVAGAARRALGEGPTPESAGDLAAMAADYADREAEGWRERPVAPTGIACRAGCSFCCHVPIAATIPEVVRIARELLSEREPDDLEALRGRVERNVEARHALVGDRRDRALHPCPLLEDGRCSAYEIRPLTCRGWTSLDASRCEAFHEDPWGGTTIPFDGVHRTIAQGIALGMQAGLKSIGLEYRSVDLAAALRIALDDPRAIDRWLDGEPAFREAELAPRDPQVHRVEDALLGRPDG